MNLDTPRQSSISVAVRVRPFTPSEHNKLIPTPETAIFTGDGLLLTSEREVHTKPNGIRKIVNVVDDKMLIFDPPDTNPLTAMHTNAFPNGKPRIRDYKFVFDQLFDEDASQRHVYENTTKPLIDSILDGFNGTVFAYGATGCGKTHTILGTPADPGVIFLTMQELFERISEVADTKVVEVTILYLEIYNETIRDLLCPETPHKKLVLREDANKRITVANLLSQKPLCVEEVMELIMVGNQNRTLSPTEANAASSRSHAVLQINVVLRDRTASLNEEHNFATLSIIDLAGSERAAATKNRGARLNEGANINKSLLALGNCINALCDPRRRHHVPYRNSKLTRLLKFSLGGNCKTVMIVCISPLSLHYDETLNTLKYADRAKEIKTKVIRNRRNMDRHVGSYLKMITEQKQEIEELRVREERVVKSAVDRHAANAARCMDAILSSVSSLKVAIDKQKHEKWKRYFLLAKRKILLLQQNHLSVLLLQLDNKQPHYLLEQLRHFLVQADQLRNKINEQIVHLEQQYDSPSEIDHLFGRSMEFTLKKLEEMDGWTGRFTDTYRLLVESAKDSLQKDLLINSSILFDYLVNELNDFNYLSQGLSRLVEACTKNKSVDTDEIRLAMEQITLVLESMNNSDYDVAIEERTAAFMQSRPNLDGKSTNINTHIPELDATTIKPGEKRASTSPLRSARSVKKFFKDALSDHPASMPLGDADTSIDDSIIMPRSDMEDDSPLGNHIVDRSLDNIDFNPLLNSPPLARMKQFEMSPKFKPLTETKLSPNGGPNHILKFPLLNKLASTKVVHNGGEGASGITANDPFDVE